MNGEFILNNSKVPFQVVGQDLIPKRLENMCRRIFTNYWPILTALPLIEPKMAELASPVNKLPWQP